LREKKQKMAMEISENNCQEKKKKRKKKCVSTTETVLGDFESFFFFVSHCFPLFQLFFLLLFV